MTQTAETLLTSLLEVDTFMATDEHAELVDVSDDPYLNALVESGILFEPEKGIVCDFPLGQCHQSVAMILLAPKEGDRLFTGYALNTPNNEWFQHSFVVNDGQIVEPGPTLFAAYYGVELVGDDREKFVAYWSKH